MATQPANSTIVVKYQVRTYRESNRHESVKAITSWLRPLNFSVPSQEIRVINTNVDTTSTDFSSYAKDGFPIVVGTRAAKAISVVENMSSLDMPVEIGHDVFYSSVDASLADNDLHQQLRDA